MKIKLSELKQIIKEELQATTRSVPKQKKVKQLTLSELRSIVTAELGNPATLGEGLWDKIKSALGLKSKHHTNPKNAIEKVLAKYGIGWSMPTGGSDDPKDAYWSMTVGPGAAGMFSADDLIKNLKKASKDDSQTSTQALAWWVIGAADNLVEKNNEWFDFWNKSWQSRVVRVDSMRYDAGDLKAWAEKAKDREPSDPPTEFPHDSIMGKLGAAASEMGVWEGDEQKAHPETERRRKMSRYDSDAEEERSGRERKRKERTVSRGGSIGGQGGLQ